MYAQEKHLYVIPTKLVPIPPANDGLSDSFYKKCYFCEKDCHSQSINKNITERLSARFHCHFCLRKGYHVKNNRNILMLSFRSIIGHFYYTNYLTITAGRKMYLSDIEDYIESHKKAGLFNPVFDYDPESFIWFVDFDKVGESKCTIEIILQTVVSILSCFNLTRMVPGVSTATLFRKYKDAIMTFYQTRRRLVTRRILSPSLLIKDKSRFFTPREMNAKK